MKLALSSHDDSFSRTTARTDLPAHHQRVDIPAAQTT